MTNAIYVLSEWAFFSFFYSDLKLVFKWPAQQVSKDINGEMLLQKYRTLPRSPSGGQTMDTVVPI